MYTLGGGIHEEQGWGRGDESFAVKEELAAYGLEPQWFGLGDRDVATHVVRTLMLDQGYPLSQVTEALCARWQPGVRLLPMTDERVETHVVVEDEAGRRAIHFQEWWVRLHASVPALEFVPVGVDDAKPAPGVLEAIADADVVLLPPSNPVVSIGTILAVPGIKDALAATAAPVVGRLAHHRRRAGARHGRRLPDRPRRRDVRGRGRRALHRADRRLARRRLRRRRREPLAGVTAPDVRVVARPLLMSDPETTRALARAAFDLALELRGVA